MTGPLPFSSYLKRHRFGLSPHILLEDRYEVHTDRDITWNINVGGSKRIIKYHYQEEIFETQGNINQENCNLCFLSQGTKMELNESSYYVEHDTFIFEVTDQGAFHLITTDYKLILAVILGMN